MGLVNKLKNILFEEEEVEVPVLEKKEKVISEPVIREMPRKEEVHNTPDYSSFYNEEAVSKPRQDNPPVVEAPRREEIKTNVDQVSEREIFKSEKTFNFPAFDEEEFESSLPRRSTNVMEHERRKAKDKNLRKVEAPKKEEVKEVKTKFRPSPIISPVYGILDKNYTPDDITTREVTPKALDVDSVRKKAFGTLEEEIIDMPIASKYPEIDADNDILEEKLEKARTIDELLKDSSDEILDVDNSFSDKIYDTSDFSNINLDNTLTNLSNSMENENIEENLNATIDSLEDVSEAKTQVDTTPVEEEDSLESDLFDLIDSMYENREDGE